MAVPPKIFALMMFFSGSFGSPASTKKAWCVLVEDDSEIVGAVALGSSLVSVGTSASLVALTGKRVRHRARSDLEGAGYHIVSVIDRPKETSRFDHSVSLASNLSSYEVVTVAEIYSLALENIDELFKCPGSICAVYDQSADNAFAAPAVVRPGPEVVRRLGACPYFDPLGGDAKKEGECFRLPTRYGVFSLWLALNADADHPTRLVRSANEPDEAWTSLRRARMVHLALGPLRPWHWWVSLPLGKKWRRARDDGFRMIDAKATDASARFESSAFENFSLARACLLPWILVAALLMRWRRRQVLVKRSARSSQHAQGACIHLAVLTSLAVALFVSDGSQSSRTFFRPSTHLLYRRSPVAPALVFYCTATAFVAAAGILLLVSDLRTFSLSIILPFLIHAGGLFCLNDSPSILGVALPLVLAFVALPLATTSTLLASDSKKGTYYARRPSSDDIL